MVVIQEETAMRRHRRHANPFTLRGPLEPLDLDALFGRDAPLALDIGCGPGRFVLELAQVHPEWNVLGVEIRPHLVNGCLSDAVRLGLKNAQALLANANLQLPESLPDAKVCFVSVNFPDPWYKKRHRKRRVVNAKWLEDLMPALAPGAQLHCMSDFLPIAEEMRAVLDGDERWERAFEEADFAEVSTTGLPTEREITHQARNEPIYRLSYKLCGPTTRV